MYEDIFEKDEESLKEYVNTVEDGVYFDEFTEDPLIARWERQMRMGLTPDLEEGWSEEKKAAFKEKKGKQQKSSSALSEAEQRLKKVIGDGAEIDFDLSLLGKKKK